MCSHVCSDMHVYTYTFALTFSCSYECANLRVPTGSGLGSDLRCTVHHALLWNRQVRSVRLPCIPSLPCITSLHAYYRACLPCMSVSCVCLQYLYYMSVLHNFCVYVHFICAPFTCASYVRLICAPYMCALYVQGPCRTPRATSSAFAWYARPPTQPHCAHLRPYLCASAPRASAPLHAPTHICPYICALHVRVTYAHYRCAVHVSVADARHMCALD